MKILHITHGYLPESTGGTETHVRELLRQQQSAGLEVVLLVGSMEPWGTPGLEDEQVVEGVRVRRLHRDDWFFDIHTKAYHPGVERLVRQVIAEEQPDLVHVHHWIRMTSNLLEITDDLGIPAIATLHDLYTSCPRAFRVRNDGEPCSRPLGVESCYHCVPRYGHESELEITEGIRLHADQYRSELERARALLVPSDATSRMISETTGFPLDRFTTIDLPYAPRFPDGAPPPAPLPGPDEPFRFGYWGNVTIRKGVQVLLQAVRELSDRGAPRPFEVHVFGKVDTDELGRQLDELAAGQPVTLHGRYEYDRLGAAGLHLAVFPIICFETFGFVLDEAIELGLPSIVTDIGALPVRAGESALRVPSNDASALSRTLEKALAQPEIRDRLASHLPPLPPTASEYARAVMDVYGRAANSGPKPIAHPVDPLRRAAFAVQQRETALRAAHSGRGPE